MNFQKWELFCGSPGIQYLSNLLYNATGTIPWGAKDNKYRILTIILSSLHKIKVFYRKQGTMIFYAVNLKVLQIFGAFAYNLGRFSTLFNPEAEDANRLIV